MSKPNSSCWLLAIVTFCIPAFAAPQLINYQGHLASPMGTPLDTTVTMTFAIYDSVVGGGAVWTETHPSVQVVDGLFAVQLGSVSTLTDVFDANCWLGISVGNNEEMTPRQQVVSVAHAYRVGTVTGATGGAITGNVSVDSVITSGVRFGDGSVQTTAVTGMSAYQLDSDTNEFDATRSWVQSRGYMKWAIGAVSSTAFVGGGASHSASGDFSTIAGGILGNASGPFSAIGGGDSNQAEDSAAVVAGGRTNNAAGPYSAITGGQGNWASGAWSYIGGGQSNTASGVFSSVGGGDANTSSAQSSVISGGSNNQASGQNSFVGGGANNYARGQFSWIGGGGNGIPSDSNSAQGNYSTILGGARNETTGRLTLSAGYRAKALHDGSFVWADSSANDFSSTAQDQFLIRASGGVGIGLSNPAEQLEVNGDVKADTILVDAAIRFPDGTTLSSGDLSALQQDADTNSFDATRAWATANSQQDGDTNSFDATKTWVQSNGYLKGMNNVVSSTGFVGGGDHNKARGTNSVIGGGGTGSAADSNSASSDLSFIGGGSRNFASNIGSAIVAGSINRASGQYSFVGGGSGNFASGDSSLVVGGRNNICAGGTSAVLGGLSNIAFGPYSTTCGGVSNSASGIYSVVAGGFGNSALLDGASVSGGIFNTATGGTIAGGEQNIANLGAAVGGGRWNHARGPYSTIVGGGGLLIADSNSASGICATIAGGRANVASGDNSFAAGRNAQALHRGSFVWSDTTSGPFSSNAVNQFLIRASGGVGIGLSSPVEQLEVNGDVKADTFRVDAAIRFPDGTIQTTSQTAFQLDADTLTWDATRYWVMIQGYVTSANSQQDSDTNLWDATRSWVTGSYQQDSDTSTWDATRTWVTANSQQDSDTSTWDATRTWVKSMGYLKGANNVVSSTGFVGGGDYNKARGAYSTVGGGGNAVSADSNSAVGNYSTIGGGKQNYASAGNSSVFGGINNRATGASATVGGGSGNLASGGIAVVAGGLENIAGGGDYSAVGGGYSNMASDYAATIPGGYNCSASGRFSFAAGRRANANDDGAFVWADSTDATFTSPGVNTFNVRASGGTNIFSNSGLSAGVTLAAGGGSWSSVSDSTLKENFKEVDGNKILKKLEHLKIREWNYISQDDKIRHMGPMAQDFYAAFGLGESDTTISTIDPDGVALAAIQELAKRSERIELLETEVAELKQLVSQLVQLGMNKSEDQLENLK